MGGSPFQQWRLVVFQLVVFQLVGGVLAAVESLAV